MAGRKLYSPPVETGSALHFARGNFAFIDGQNVHLGVRSLGWELDWPRFRQYLQRRYGVTTAYVFLGYLRENAQLYRALEEAGYTLVFKQVTISRDGRIKGNVDAELVLQTMIDIESFDSAVLVTSDGDFACLVRHLRTRRKLRSVITPCRRTCSALLRRAAGAFIDFLDQRQRILEYQKQQKAP